MIWDARNETESLRDRRRPVCGARIGSVGPAVGQRLESAGHRATRLSSIFIISRRGVPSIASRSPIWRAWSAVPRSNEHKAYDGRHAVILNEYAWLWLNRDGSPTTLTKGFYDHALGENAIVAQRRHLYATHFAAETEIVRRSYRHVAALMHFCSLGYSRADGQTSDHWTVWTKLSWEPEFHRYLRDAFARSV